MGASSRGGLPHDTLERLIAQGHEFRVTRLTEEYGFEDWRAKRPDALPLAWISGQGTLHVVSDTATVAEDESGHLHLAEAMTDRTATRLAARTGPDIRLIALIPPEPRSP
ncbi:MAG: hypothetical protein Kow0013_28520 [Pararhodobacter sp.]